MNILRKRKLNLRLIKSDRIFSFVLENICLVSLVFYFRVNMSVYSLNIIKKF
jgi:hypothetical protein